MRGALAPWIGAAGLAAVAWCGCDGEVSVDDDDSAPAEPRVVREIVVAGSADHEAVAGDLFLPGGAAEPPVVVMVHGGAFKGGSRDELEPLAQALADDGLAVFNVDYRLLEHGGEFPGALVDVQDASRYLRAHAAVLGVGPVCGHLGVSGGATLVALASLHRGDADLARDAWPALRGYPTAAAPFVGISGVYDFNTREEQHGELPWWESDWLGGLPAEVPQTYDYASARLQAALAEGPVLLMHGEADDAVEPQQSQDFADALADASVATELVLYPDGPHGFIWPLDGADGADALARSLAALHDACDGGAVEDGARGTTEVRQSGLLEGTGAPGSFTGTESYAWGERDGSATLCEATLATAATVDDDGVIAVSYAVESLSGDCDDAPYLPGDGEVLSLRQGADTRDGRAVLARDVPGKTWMSWFDVVDDGDGALAYERTTIVAP